MRLVILNNKTPAFVMYESHSEATQATVITSMGEILSAVSNMRDPLDLQELQSCFKLVADYYEHNISFPFRETEAVCKNCGKVFNLKINVTNMQVCP